MSYRRYVTLFAVSLSLTSGAHAQVDSKSNWGSLYSPTGPFTYMGSRRACNKGDILTIIVNESSAASFNASTSTTKADSNVVNNTTLPLANWLKVGFLDAVMSGGSSGATSSVAGTGATTNTGSFVSQLAVIVKEVLPNGNLVVEGKRSLTVNKDIQTIVFSGVVRRDDVTAANTVQSTNVANAEIHSEGKGAIADRQRQGILTRILSWLF